MQSVCDPCKQSDHVHCDPIGFWCGCFCWTGELLDPLRVPDQREEDDQ